MPQTLVVNKISEEEFLKEIVKQLAPFRNKVRAVTGPKRSGAVAAVYASYLLGVPFISCGTSTDLRPLLVIDTARLSGASLKQTAEFYGTGAITLALYEEPPRHVFWYEEIYFDS